jgi:hypothetical protein
MMGRQYFVDDGLGFFHSVEDEEKEQMFDEDDVADDVDT